MADSLSYQTASQLSDDPPTSAPSLLQVAIIRVDVSTICSLDGAGRSLRLWPRQPHHGSTVERDTLRLLSQHWCAEKEE
jgi:hypothetical protein